MKILHTSDWHLGQKLIEKDRAEEHKLFLDWLLEVLEEKQINILVIAGDIFDTHNPPKEAENYYADFLARASKITEHIVIIAGNHDSTATLEAYKAVLKALDIHVVGSFNEDPAQEILPLRNRKSKQIETVVAAVPFLRDNLLIRSIPREDIQDRKERMVQAMYDHYQRIAEATSAYEKEKIPLIATGHLFVAGAKDSESERQIHVGTLDCMKADIFAPIFSYVALGHLHRPQQVAQKEFIRYSGSPIPLSFGEVEDKKSTKEVVLLEYNGSQLQKISPISVPTARSLKRFKGTFEEVMDAMEKYNFENIEGKLEPWFDAVITANTLSRVQYEKVQEVARQKKIELLSIKLESRNKDHSNNSQIEDYGSLDWERIKLDPIELFKKKYQADNGKEPSKELMDAFYELFSIVQNNESTSLF
ncbi:MAG: exonuclease SbcCD subunit D C-terminal domain-containing protein [Bacteroidia bacterium]|nr:exonuclease SbcCD subunit D C-terminal domain-containing protein [Bacteroidia bacterium]MDW8158732.1 exonuclease SbcCD subunit D C-terminal domain-containing protein [Bacteroidia bacterium]